MKRHSRSGRCKPSRPAVAVERFTGKAQTHFGGAGLARRFMERIGVAERLMDVIMPWQGRAFQPWQYLMALLYGIVLGLQRQVDISRLRADPGALLALGIEQVPSQPSISRFLAACSRPVGERLLKVNRQLIGQVRGERRLATIDLDGQVVVARGTPGGADFGYNPKRRGSRSYFVLMGFWGELRDILDAQLLAGSKATLSGKLAIETYRRARRALSQSVVRFRLRADAAFCIHEFLSRLEQDDVNYAIAMRLSAPLKVKLPGLEYRRVGKRWALAEFFYQGAEWKHPRRIVVVRERLEPENPRSGQLTLFKQDGFAYQAIVTSATWRDEIVWSFYNHRSCLENIIKESQYDFGSNHVLSRWVGGNATWLALSVLGYNILNWFREKILGQRQHRHMAKWLRQHLLEIPAVVVHSGRRYYLNIWRDHPDRELFEKAIVALEGFRL